MKIPNPQRTTKQKEMHTNTGFQKRFTRRQTHPHSYSHTPKHIEADAKQ